MSKKLESAVASVLLIAVVLLIATPVSAALAPGTRPPAGKRILDTKFLDINRWVCPFYNDGRWAIDITKTNYPGAYWPAPKKNFQIFGGGLWVGAISAANETLVSVGYNPNSGANEFFPTMANKAEEGSGNVADRIYKYGTADWPPDKTRFPPGPDSLVPTENFSLQDMWMVFTDARKDRHVSPGKPLGLEVYLTVYAWNYPSNQDIFFLKYRVKNATGQMAGGTPTDLRNVYFGFCLDVDVGNAEDDMVGMIHGKVFNEGKDTVWNVGLVGDNNNIEPDGSSGADRWEGGQPGTVGVKYLESPLGPDGRQLGMTAFKKFTLDIDPPTDAAQFLTLAGIDYRTGIYNKYDSVDNAPGDKRIIECSGPFDLKADSVKTVVAAVFCAYHGRPGVTWENRTDEDLLELVKTAQSAQFIYDRGWLLPGPPESPNVTLIPMDNRVRITWDNHSEVTPAKYYKVASDSSPGNAGWDPLYREYDFQGYKVWKSKDGFSWKLLTQCDLIDGDTYRDTTQPDSIASKPAETGLFYSFVDDSVINGFTYYYSVTAYCHNYSTGRFDSTGRIPIETLHIFLEGGKRGIATTPRWNPVNVDSALVNVRRLVGNASTSGLTCSAKVIVPFRVNAGDTFILKFLDPIYAGDVNPRFRWTVQRLRSDSLVVDTMSTVYQLGDPAAAKTFKTELPPFGGLATRLRLKMGLPTGVPAFDSVRVISGSYPRDTIKIGSAAATGKWAFRGSDYRITWRRTGNTVRAVVRDLSVQPTALTTDTLGITDSNYNIVPYRPYGRIGSTLARPESANGWCFVDNRFWNPSDTLKRDSTANLYLCGYYIQLNKGGTSGLPIGSLMDLIQDGDVWEFYGNKNARTSPAHNIFMITGTPERVITQRDTGLRLRVRVVPNPYIITNDWEFNSFDRKLAFTGLPAECEIRIYTMAGDLVKLIKHRATKSDIGAQPGELGGTETWNLLNSSDQLIATGVYVFHVKSDVGEAVGKFAIVR